MAPQTKKQTKNQNTGKPICRHVYNSWYWYLSLYPRLMLFGMICMITQVDAIILAPSRKDFKLIQAHWLPQSLYQVSNQAVAPQHCHPLFLCALILFRYLLLWNIWSTFYPHCTFPVIRDWSLLLSVLATADTLKPWVTSTVYKVEYRDFSSVPGCSSTAWGEATALSTEPAHTWQEHSFTDQIGDLEVPPPKQHQLTPLCKWAHRGSYLRLLHLRQRTHRENKPASRA